MIEIRVGNDNIFQHLLAWKISTKLKQDFREQLPRYRSCNLKLNPVFFIASSVLIRQVRNKNYRDADVIMVFNTFSYLKYFFRHGAIIKRLKFVQTNCFGSFRFWKQWGFFQKLKNMNEAIGINVRS